jgi:hypothetical protein
MALTKEEIAELIDRVPRGMDADVFLVDLINLAIEEHTKKTESRTTDHGKTSQSMGTRRKTRRA